MNIFITGATGFIGTHLVRRLAKTKHQIYCLIRNPNNAVELTALGANITIGDVTDKASVLKGMKGCNWVINLANIYSYWEPNKQIYTKVNIEGTQNVMECALETGVSKVVHLSSVVVYGKPDDCPFTEMSPIGPVRFSEYAKTKYLGDLKAWELYEKKGLPLVVIYPAGVTGPDDPKASGQFISDLVHRRLPITSFNNSIITWVHVKDVVETILKSLEKENNIGEKYLVGKFQLSYKELYQMIAEISGVPLPKIALSNLLVTINAVILTWFANLTKKPPFWQLSTDLARTQIEGIRCDGSKVERELGITYTPIRQALEEAIKSYGK